MSWKHPKENIRDEDALSPEAINRNFQAVDEEVYGRLNEHNFKASAFTGVSHYADDIAMRLYHAEQYSDGGDDPDYGVTTSNEFLIPQSGQWAAVTGATKTFTSAGALIWIMASFQLQSEELGVQCALRINGAIDPDTIWPYADAEVERQELATTTSSSRNSPGECSTLSAVVLETVTPVPPGSCVVELMVRTALEERFPASVTSREKYAVYNRELIIIEMLEASR